MKLPWVGRASYELVLALFDRQQLVIDTLRAEVAGLVQEITGARQQHGSMMSELMTQVMELKRDGLVVEHPDAGPTVDRSSDGLDTEAGLGDALPDDVLAAIDERSDGQPPAVRRLLVKEARKAVRELRRKQVGEREIEATVERLILDGAPLE